MGSVLSVLNIITDYGIIKVEPIFKTPAAQAETQPAAAPEEPMPLQVPSVKPSSRRCDWSNAQNGLIPDESYGPRYRSLTAAFEDCDEDGECQYVSQVQDPAGTYFIKGKGNLTPLSNQSKIPRSVITCQTDSFRNLPPVPPKSQSPPAETPRTLSSQSNTIIPDRPSTVAPATGVCKWDNNFVNDSIPISFFDQDMDKAKLYTDLQSAKDACDADPSCAYVVKRTMKGVTGPVGYILSKLGDMITTDKNERYAYSSLKCTHSTATQSGLTTSTCSWSNLAPTDKIPSSVDFNKDTAYYTLEAAKEAVEKDTSLMYILMMASKTSPDLKVYYTAKGELVPHTSQRFNMSMTQCTRARQAESQKGGGGAGGESTDSFEGGILRVPKLLPQVNFLSRSIGDLININY
jgi:hypothetical protein